MSERTQKSLALVKVGEPLEIINTLIPTPGPNQLLIKITAAGLCPADNAIIKYGFFNVADRLPYVVGFDIVGTVEAIGPGVSQPKVGDRVFSQCDIASSMIGGLQEYTLADAEFSLPVPDAVSDLQMTAFPVNAMTAAQCLFVEGLLGFPLPGTKAAAGFDYAGQHIVVIGGGSNVGKLIINMAALAGIGTIIATSSTRTHAELKAAGATHTIDRTLSEEVIKGVIENDILGADNITNVIDVVNRGPSDTAINLLSNTKPITLVDVSFVQPSDEAKAAKKGSLTHKGPFGTNTVYPAFSKQFWPWFLQELQRGNIQHARLGVVDGLVAEKVNAAFDEIGKDGQKIAIKIV